MLEMPLVQSGCFVSMATSNDEDHPASNIIDGNEQTFWTTTGLYPQTVVLSFPQCIEIKSIKIYYYGIKSYIVEKSVKANPIEFDVIGEKNLKMEDNLRFSTSELKIGNGSDARHIKFVITDAYDSFAAIQHIKVDYAKGSR